MVLWVRISSIPRPSMYGIVPYIGIRNGVQDGTGIYIYNSSRHGWSGILHLQNLLSAPPLVCPFRTACFARAQLGSLQQEKLVNVRHLAATDGAFAALKDDGTVVAWGDESHGGRCPSDLQNVQESNDRTVSLCGKSGEWNSFQNS